MNAFVYFLTMCISCTLSMYCTHRVCKNRHFMFSVQWWIMMGTALILALAMLFNLF